MTPSELKHNVQASNADSHYFDPKAMRAFGDTMSNYGVRSAIITVRYDAEGNYLGEQGEQIEVWELYRKRPVKMGLCDSSYFRKDTFNRTFPVREG